MVYLRVLFTIISALCVAALVPLGLAFGWAWVGYCFFGALVSFIFMLFCKQSQELKELKKENAEKPTADFFSATNNENTDNKKETNSVDKK